MSEAVTSPLTDFQTVVETEIKEWHFRNDIYFLQRNPSAHHAALELRDAVLRLRRDGAFVAAPLFRVNTEPVGPHPVGSYEIWVPAESFSSVFSYLCMNRGDLSTVKHSSAPIDAGRGTFTLRVSYTLSNVTFSPKRKDHEIRSAWMGPAFTLDLSTLPVKSEEIPLQYASLQLGYSSIVPPFNMDERRQLGAHVEKILAGEKEAARAPRD